MQRRIQPERWGLKAGDSGELMIGNHGVLSLVQKYGTPLHVVNERRLAHTAKRFIEEVTAAYPGTVSAYYALKCNSVPAVVETIRSAGLNAEVMSECELDLAVNLGFTGEQIIVNGPCKTDRFLVKCLARDVRFIIVDSLEELDALDALSRLTGRKADILLRLNPDYHPHHLNRGTATGTRICAFGLRMEADEMCRALARLPAMESLNFMGFHMHIGTGIRDPQDYVRSIDRVKPAIEEAHQNGLMTKVLDVGGGFASPTTREFTTSEMFTYHALGRLPGGGIEDPVSMGAFARAISGAVRKNFQGHGLPELLYEPGRCIAGPNQFLLLTVCRTKSRRGVGTWLITDGGLSTVTLPTYYEHHEVMLCNDLSRPCTKRVNLIGPACFAGDIIYRNKLMPEAYPGDVMAIMDSGAYFTALESSFGFPRPAIVSVNGAEIRIIRSRETYDDMISRDIFHEGNTYEIRNQEEHAFPLAG